MRAEIFSTEIYKWNSRISCGTIKLKYVLPS